MFLDEKKCQQLQNQNQEVSWFIGSQSHLIITNILMLCFSARTIISAFKRDMHTEAQRPKASWSISNATRAE